MKDIVNYWEEEWRKITDFANVTSKDDLMLGNQNNIRPLQNLASSLNKFFLTKKAI